MRRLSMYVLFALGMTVATANLSWAAVIDSFNDPAGGYTQATPGGFVQPGSAAIGGTRNGMVTWSNTEATLRINSAGNPGQLSLTTNSTAIPGVTTVQLTYSPGAAGNFSGETGIQVVFTNVDMEAATPPGTMVEIILNDGNSIHNSSAVILAAGAPTIDLPFSGFSDSGNLDTSTVTSITVTIHVPEDGNIRVDEIRTFQDAPPAVPEPASLAVWAMVGVAGVWYGRRRLLTPVTA